MRKNFNQANDFFLLRIKWTLLTDSEEQAEQSDMAKTGLTFYKAETIRFRDRKIRKLVKHFSCAGYAVYDYVLNEIYGDKGCFVEWDEDTAFDVAEYFGIKESLVIEIVNYCCVVGLFNKELLDCERVLTSKAIQERYVEACSVMKRSIRNVPERLKIPEETQKIPEETPNLPEEIPKPPEDCAQRNVTKRNVTKHNRISENFVLPFANDSPVMEAVRRIIPEEPVRSAIRDWVSRVYDMGLTLDEISVGLHLKDLLAISTDSDTQLKVVEQSTKRGWKGFFALKSLGGDTPKPKEDVSEKDYSGPFFTRKGGDR